MTHTKANRLLWLDLETTGLDERAHRILEIGVVATDLDLSQLWESSWVIGQPAHVLAELPDFLAQMHAKSGLLDAVRSARDDWTGPLDGRLAAVDATLAQLMDSDMTWALAGSGVSHFDRLFIREQMPALEARLVYYNLDLGVLRRCLGIFGGPSYDVSLPESYDTEVKAHRALPDAHAHLAEARAYRDRLRTLGARSLTVGSGPC